MSRIFLTASKPSLAKPVAIICLTIPLEVFKAYTAKPTAARILQQYATLAKGEGGPSERLAQDLVFFCAQAQAAPEQHAAALAAVRLAYGLQDSPAVNYTTEQFGRFDPAQLALARKRIAAAAETWSALAGGDSKRLKQTGDQFAAVAAAADRFASRRHRVNAM